MEASLRARVLSYSDDTDKESNTGDNSVDESPDANHQYAKLKLEMSEIQRAQGAAKRANKAKSKGIPQALTEQDELMELQVGILKKRIKAVEGDYTFRKPDAGMPAFLLSVSSQTFLIPACLPFRTSLPS